jgi:chromosome segregation ATPase
MAEEIVFNVQSNIKSVTKDTEDYTKSLTGVEFELDRVNQSLKASNKFLADQKIELINLKAKQDAIPKGGWYAGMDNLNKKIKETEKNIKEEAVVIGQLKEEQKSASKEVSKFNKELKETNKESKDSIGNFKVMGVSLNGVKSSFGKIIPLAKTMFGTIKAGILSTGVGALLIAFGSLVAYFTSTKKGADQLKVVFAALGATVNVLKDRISGVGEAISLVFSGKWKEAGEALKGTFAGIGAEIKADVAAMTALEKRTQALRDAEIEFTIQRAETRKEIEKARLLAEDETKSQEVRIAALKKALDFETETTNKELELARERVAIQEEQMDTAENLVEAEKQLADFKADLINKETKSIRLQKRVQTEINELERELLTEKKQRAKEEQDIINKKIVADQEQMDLENQAKLDAYNKLKALEDENFLASIEDEKERALALLDIQYDAELESLSQYENYLELKEQLDIKYNNAKEALDTKQKEWEEYTTKERLGLASDAFGQMSEIMGKETKAGQAAAVVQAGISTYLGAQEAYTSMAKIPVVGPVLGGIAAAAAVAMGLKNIAAIKSGGKSGGGSTNIPAPSTSNTPAPEMLSGKFELGNVEQEQQPVQAYVVTDNLTDNQNKLAYIRRRATI